MLSIAQYESEDKDGVIELVLHCQNDGSRPEIKLSDQLDLLCIPEKYMHGGGNFWVAKDDGKIAGSIALVDCGGGVGILKKFFVYEPYRGKPHNLGQRLYAILIEYAKARGMTVIVLDTPFNTERAHKFYEKAGFVQVAQADLPVQYDYPFPDSHFFRLDLAQ